MKVLLDTNIIIHREAIHAISRDIATLFKWFDRGKYTKCVHPVTVEENHALRSQFVTSSWVYHFGASLKDLGKKWFAFSKFDKDAFKLLERLAGVIGE